MLIFTTYETLFENVTTILPTTYQSKTKIPGEKRKCLVYLQELTSHINNIEAIQV